MVEAAASILKIVLFLILGIFFRKEEILKSSGIEGIKKIILTLAIPSVLFLSFSRLNITLGLLPVILGVFSINLILFWIGFLIYKMSGSKNRLLPLYITTMNFALLGIPLYEALYGIGNLQHYTMFGIGHETFMWFVFYFLLRWFLSEGREKGKLNLDFLKSPIIWSIVLGCLFSILHIDISSGDNAFLKGISETIISASGLGTPLILIFIGYNISISKSQLRESFKYIFIRLAAVYLVGYLVKFLVIDRFIVGSEHYNAAYFLLLSLPPVFSIPILAADYLESDELSLINNTIVIHALFTIILFAMYAFFVTF